MDTNLITLSFNTKYAFKYHFNNSFTFIYLFIYMHKLIILHLQKTKKQDTQLNDDVFLNILYILRAHEIRKCELIEEEIYCIN